MNDDAHLLEDLVERVPALRKTYEIHVANEGGVLAHLLMADVFDDVMNAFQGTDEADPDLDWRAVLAFLEERLAGGDLAAARLIVTSFLDYVPYPGRPGHDLAAELGPVMARRLAALQAGDPRPS